MLVYNCHMEKDIEYGNMRYQQGYDAGYDVGFDAGVSAEAKEEAWDEGFNEGFEAGEMEGYQTGWQDGSGAEQSRIQAIIKMNMEWAVRDNKGADFIRWKNIGEILSPLVGVPQEIDDEF